MVNTFNNNFIKWFYNLQRKDNTIYNFTISNKTIRIYKVINTGRKTVCFVDKETGNIYKYNKKKIIGNIYD